LKFERQTLKYHVLLSKHRELFEVVLDILNYPFKVILKEFGEKSLT